MVLLFGTIVAFVVLYAAGRDCYVEAGLEPPGSERRRGSIDNGR